MFRVLWELLRGKPISDLESRKTKQGEEPKAKEELGKARRVHVCGCICVCACVCVCMCRCVCVCVVVVMFQAEKQHMPAYTEMNNLLKIFPPLNKTLMLWEW